MERLVVATAWALAAILVHGLVLAGAAGLSLRALRDADAAIRCRIIGAALIAVPVLFVATWGALVLADTTTAAEATASVAASTGAAGFSGATGLRAPAGMPVWLVTLAWTITAAWLTVAALFLVRLGGSAMRVARLARSGRPVSSPALRRLYVDASLRAGVTGVRFRSSQLVDVPTIVGMRPATLLLPVAIERSLSPAELELLLAHELAHVARRDYALNIAQAVLEALFFFHPAVRWLSARLRVEREFACDDAAIACGRPLTLARALERLESLRAPLRLSLAATSGSLLHRVVRLLSPRRDPPPTHRLLAAVATPVCTLALAALTFTALPPDLVGATLRAAAPAAKVAQHIDARDDAGEFSLSIVGLRAVAASIAGQPLPPERIVQRRDSVHLMTPDGAALLSVHVRESGGIAWDSRPPPSPRTR